MLPVYLSLWVHVQVQISHYLHICIIYPHFCLTRCPLTFQSEHVHVPPPPSVNLVAMALSLELNSERYVQLLEKLIGESEFLQNNPPQFIPHEDRYAHGRTIIGGFHFPTTNVKLWISLLDSIYIYSDNKLTISKVHVCLQYLASVFVWGITEVIFNVIRSILNPWSGRGRMSS